MHTWKLKVRLKKSQNRKLSGPELLYASCIFACVFIGILLWDDAVSAKERTGAIIITAKQIKEMNVHKICDVLNHVPGVNAGDSFVSIRGSYKVKVLLDGRPINDPASGHGLVKFDLVSLENVEKIEIYRGKGALKYGDDASGGVILITTKKSRAFHGNIKSYWGNYDTSHYSANCRLGKGAFGVGTSVGYEYTGGYQVNGDQKKKRAAGKLEYVPDNGSGLTFSVDYLKDERGLSGRPEYPTPHSRKQSEMYSYALSAKVMGIDSKTFFNDAKTKNKDPDRGVNNTITVRKFGEDISMSIEAGKWGTINYGVAFRWDQAESSRFASKDEQSKSLFVTDSISFDGLPISFSFGLRGTVYSEFDNTLNPEAKMSYKNGKWFVSLSYSRTNNVPSFYQRYDKTSTKKPNPGLKMETADNLSLSFFIEVSPRLSCGASAFYNRITDRITYVLGNNWIGRYENFGEVTYKGGDLLLNWKITKMLSLKMTYIYLEAINEDTGLWMVAKPRHRVYADLTCVPIKDLSVIFNLKYESRQYTRSDNKASVPCRAIGNLRLEYDPAWAGCRYGHPEFFGEIKNISDKTYRYGDGWLAPPRTWTVGVNYRF